MINSDVRIQGAVRHFWQTRLAQASSQIERGVRDQGARGAVTGGKQMDGFVTIVQEILHECGISDDEVFCRRHLELPGYYRPEKKWDILAVAGGRLVAVVEFKSMATSFGNNLNNRVEEAVGSAADLWTAYREGAFPVTPKPWLGYLMLLVECAKSTQPVSVREPHFEVFPEFKGASYAARCRVLLERLVRERLYDAACFLMTPDASASTGDYSEPARDLAFQYFEESLRASVMAFQRSRAQR